MTEAVIFDFDGTLYRDEETAYEEFKDAVLDLLDRNGTGEPERMFETARKAVKNGLYSSTKAFLADQGITANRFEDVVHPAVCGAATRTDRSHIIEELQDNGLRVDVLTNNSERLVQQYLGQVGHEVETIVGAETLPALKPEEESFRSFIGAVPYTFDDAVYVDDGRENIAAAASLGMETHHLDQGTTMDELHEVVR